MGSATEICMQIHFIASLFAPRLLKFGKPKPQVFVCIKIFIYFLSVRRGGMSADFDVHGSFHFEQ